ncbi:zinc-finger associated domain (zf-AD) domain-containing protein [Phthorimaea operculella]|nr:zinc-finger associated domain (zf-AD) domain-containing protein [Phthorimaea operculella]
MFEKLNKTQPIGQCRCCLDFGHHESFYRNGIHKGYQQTFLETFNLCLSSNPCLPRMICKSCICRLTNAAEFIAMVKESEQYLLYNTETTSNIEFINVENLPCKVEIKVEPDESEDAGDNLRNDDDSDGNVAQSSVHEEEIIHQNELIKEEKDEIEHGQDVNPPGSVDGDTIIGLEAQPRLQVKLTRLPGKLLKLYIKHDYMNKSSDAENEVAVYNDESSAVKTEPLEQISQEYEQIDNASKDEDNIGEEIDEQDAAIDDHAKADFSSRDLKSMFVVAVRKHVEVEHADTHTDSASSLKTGDDYAPRTQITTTTCAINEINKNDIASISTGSNKYTDNISLQTNLIVTIRVSKKSPPVSIKARVKGWSLTIVKLPSGETTCAAFRTPQCPDSLAAARSVSDPVALSQLVEYAFVVSVVVVKGCLPSKMGLFVSSLMMGAALILHCSCRMPSMSIVNNLRELLMVPNLFS